MNHDKLNDHGYTVELRRLTEAEGGGWLISFPDLPGCLSDGETIAEALASGVEAVESHLASHRKHGDPVPEPGGVARSGRFFLHLPPDLHHRLAARAEEEGASPTALALSYIARGLDRPD